MSASRNKSSNTGLRILWIPGRKKHSRKGRYQPTNKRVDYSAKQPGNVPWSLGGSKGQEGLIRADISGHNEGPAISSVTASCAIALNVQQTDMKLEETNKFAMLDTFGEEGRSEQRLESTECEQNGTLPVIDKRDQRQHQVQDDVNSIEHIEGNNLNYDKIDVDRPDGSLYNVSVTKKKRNKKKKKKKENKTDEEYLSHEQDDEKVVKCLYYTLMCCECSIS